MKIRRRDRARSTILSIALLYILLTGLCFSDDFHKVKESVISNSWKKVGFVYIEPSLLLKDVGYNSNIYSYQEEETPDWTTDVGFKINFSLLLGKRFVLVVKESPYYSFYLENKELQYFNNELFSTIYTYIGRFNLKYTYSVANVLSRPTVEFGTRIKTNRNSHEFSLDYGNYNRFFIGVTAGIEELNYNEPSYFGQYNIASSSDRERTTFSLTLNKKIFTRTQLFFRSEYYNLRYRSEISRNGWGNILSTGIKFPEVGILNGEFHLGVKYFIPESPSAAKYSTLYGSGSVSFRLTRKFNLGLSYSLDTHYSFYELDQYFDLKRYTVSFNYYIRRNIKAGYSFSSVETLYKIISGEESGRKDNTNKSEFRLGVRMSGNMELGIQYTVFEGRSSFSEFSRNFHFIGGYLNHEF